MKHYQCVSVLIGTLSVGCLLPPPIESEIDLGNELPRVVTSSIFPRPEDGPVVLATATECEPQLFLLTIEDADEDDTIYWRVFVNFFESNPDQREEFENDIEQVPIGSSSVENPNERELRFSIGGSDPRFMERPEPFDNPHVIEVLASDRPFGDVRRAPRQPIPSEADITEPAIWAWTVTITDGPCQ